MCNFLHLQYKMPNLTYKMLKMIIQIGLGILKFESGNCCIQTYVSYINYDLFYK